MEEIKIVTITDKRRDDDGNKFYNEYQVLRRFGEGSVGKVCT